MYNPTIYMNAVIIGCVCFPDMSEKYVSTVTLSEKIQQLSV